MTKKTLRILVILLLAAGVITGFGVLWHSGQLIRQMSNVRVEADRSWPEGAAERVRGLDLGTKDDLFLHAWQLPHTEPSGVVVLLHGMHGVDAGSMVPYGMLLQDAGFEVLALDMRAHGESGGDTIGFAYTEMADVDRLLNWIGEQERYRGLPLALVGYSMGGAAAINTAAQRPEVDKVVSISGFASFEETFVDALQSQGLPEPLISLYRWAVRTQLQLRFGIDPQEQAPAVQIQQLADRPVLLIHGSEDEQIHVRQAHMLKEAHDGAELWILSGERHDGINALFGEPDHLQRLTAFLRR